MKLFENKKQEMSYLLSKYIHFILFTTVILTIITGSVGKLAKKYKNKQIESRECEFPPRHEIDMTHSRRKRLTTETGLVCLEDYPYTVSVRVLSRHKCGGAIVSNRWILSAAQCFDYVKPKEVTVRLGSVYRDYGGILMSVTAIRRHPNYRSDQFYPEYNLAMVRVNKDIAIGQRIKPVNLAAHWDLFTNITKHGEVVVTGYGAVKTGQLRTGVKQELRRMLVSPVSKGLCRQEHVGDYLLQKDHVCLKSIDSTIDLCSGDSGDPAVYFPNYKPPGVLYGIALFSSLGKCADKTKPAIYARVSDSRKWINEEMEKIALPPSISYSLYDDD